MPIQDVVLKCLNGHLIHQTSIKDSENKREYCGTCGAKNISNSMEWKTPLYCHECGRPYPFRALIEMVEYFELNAENAED